MSELRWTFPRAMCLGVLLGMAESRALAAVWIVLVLVAELAAATWRQLKDI